MMPAYPEALDRLRGRTSVRNLPNVLGLDDVSLLSGLMPDTGVPIWLVRCPSLYERPGGLYADTHGEPWPDNEVRFAVLCHAAARVALGNAGDDWKADVVHANDWHLGLLPALLRSSQGPRPKSLLTIHNLAFQGLFPREILPRLGLPTKDLSYDDMEFYGQVSFLKAGIRHADVLTTVSPSYAQEIQTAEFGCGLDGLLRDRSSDLVGILNGIDSEYWNPEDPVTLGTPYNADDMSGKRVCKQALQMELGLDSSAEAPIFLFMSRITEQKMADVLPEVAPRILDRGGQIAVCGRGDRSIEGALRELAQAYPGRAAIRIGYEEAGAKRLLAGADVLLAPARFEPCGLVQMYGMRYGTLPVVRRVGGLADTVRAAETNDESSTGFMFDQPNVTDFVQAIDSVVDTYRQPAPWARMQTRAMAKDFSWRRSAGRYEELYRKTMNISEANDGDAKSTQPYQMAS
jgi:starch synthase